MSLNAEEGTYNLTLWLEDTGDWEYIPHHLEQRIKINGSIVSYRRETPNQWYNRTYINPAPKAAAHAETNWLAFAQYRGAPLTVKVQPINGKIVVDLAGDRSSATHLAGLLLEPAEETTMMKWLTSARKARANSRWPVVESTDSWHKLLPANPSQITLPKEAIHFVRYTLGEEGGKVRIIHIEAARSPDSILKTKAWTPVKTLNREQANSEHLTLDNRKLQPMLSGHVMAANQIIKKYFWISNLCEWNRSCYC